MGLRKEGQKDPRYMLLGEVREARAASRKPGVRERKVGRPVYRDVEEVAWRSTAGAVPVIFELQTTTCTRDSCSKSATLSKPPPIPVNHRKRGRGRLYEETVSVPGEGVEGI